MTVFLLSFYLYPVNTKRKHPKLELGKDFFFKAFIDTLKIKIRTVITKTFE